MNLFKRRSKTSRLKRSDEVVEKGFGPWGDLVTAETQTMEPLRTQRAPRACPMKPFEEMLGRRSGSMIGDLKFSDPKGQLEFPFCVLAPLKRISPPQSRRDGGGHSHGGV